MKVNTRTGEYEIKFCSLADAFAKLPADRFVITDSNVARLYGSHLEGARTMNIPAGEKSKSLHNVEQCLETLAQHGATRASTVVAFGGGVIGDLAGVVAALYMRGVPLIHIPTSLLAQVDSSVGGKVAVDLSAGKNLAGAFYPPREVFIPVETLKTLPEKEFNNGMAEVWKYGFIIDPSLLNTLKKKVPSAGESNENIEPIVSRCIHIKKGIVEQDELETTGLRAVLNFGHTVGHALEALAGYSNLLHGEAISIGMVAEARIGEALGVTQEGTSNIVRECLEMQRLPTSFPASIQRSELISIMKRDKKRASEGLAFSLLTRIGQCKLIDRVAEAKVEKVLDAL